MLKPAIDVLVIAYNIAGAFDYLPMKERESFVRQLRGIEKDVCLAYKHYKKETEERGKP